MAIISGKAKYFLFRGLTLVSVNQKRFAPASPRLRRAQPSGYFVAAGPASFRLAGQATQPGSATDGSSVIASEAKQSMARHNGKMDAFAVAKELWRTGRRFAPRNDGRIREAD
jgi:hypothetical protein